MVPNKSTWVPLFQVDAFSDRPFAGNPAAVCLLDAPVDETWMQGMALEMALSETAFVLPCDGGYGLRWFTPTAEVDLCGHATLAAAHVLWSEGGLPDDTLLRFSTRSGWLDCRRVDGSIEMDFPARAETSVVAPLGLAAALGVNLDYVGRSIDDFLVEVADESVLLALEPDFRRLRELEVRGVIATCLTQRPGVDFVSRFFAPGVGVDEDPVTGSAHCCLAPFWAARLGRDELVGYQASARGGTVHVAVRGDRVLLRGQAVTVLRGEIRVD